MTPLDTERLRGEQSMRDAILRWHEAQRIKYREWSGMNGIAGAYMAAHEDSIIAIRALILPERIDDL